MNYQLFPDLTPEEYNELKEDIKARGVQVPIELDEAGSVLDGHHRVKICRELGITDYPTITRFDLTEDKKRLHIRKLNLARRHLTQEQKRQLIEQQLKETPELSDRQIAKGLGVDHKTIGAARGKLESTGEIPQLDKTKGADGKVRSRSIYSTSDQLETIRRENPELLNKIAKGWRTINSALAEIQRDKQRAEWAIPPLTKILMPDTEGRKMRVLRHKDDPKWCLEIGPNLAGVNVKEYVKEIESKTEFIKRQQEIEALQNKKMELEKELEKMKGLIVSEEKKYHADIRKILQIEHGPIYTHTESINFVVMDAEVHNQLSALPVKDLIDILLKGESDKIKVGERGYWGDVRDLEYSDTQLNPGNGLTRVGWGEEIPRRRRS